MASNPEEVKTRYRAHETEDGAASKTAKFGGMSAQIRLTDVVGKVHTGWGHNTHHGLALLYGENMIPHVRVQGDVPGG